jgi:hypothetical protein
MKRSDIKIEKFFEIKLNQESMNKLRGGDSPTDPNNPTVPPTGK